MEIFDKQRYIKKNVVETRIADDMFCPLNAELCKGKRCMAYIRYYTIDGEDSKTGYCGMVPVQSTDRLL